MNTDKQIKNYIQRQKNWIKANNLKLGDRVLVRKAHPSNEKGWNNEWIGSMDESIGEMCKVIYISDQEIFLNNFYGYPYTVLQKVD